MLRLRDIMTRDPITVAPETTLRVVADLLAARGISGVPVVSESGEVVGVVSVTDIVSLAATTPGVPTDRSGSFASWGEVDRTPDEEPAADEFFADYWADSEADVAQRMQDSNPEWDLLEEHTAEEVMTRRIEALSIDADLTTAAEQMMRARIHRLLVTEQGRLAGVVSASDFVRAVAERRLRG